MVNKLLPLGSTRRRYYELGLSAIRIIINEGWRSFWSKARDRLKKKKTSSMPDPYQMWIVQNEPSKQELERYRQESLSLQYRPKISIITPLRNTDEKWIKLAIESVLNQVYDNWELCIADDASTKPPVKKILRAYEKKDDRIKVKYHHEDLGISGASNEALSLASGEFIGLLDSNDELRPDALYEVAKSLNQDRSLDLIYSDEDEIDGEGHRREAFFKPDWSPDLLMSMNYISHFTVIRKDLVDSLGGFRREFEGSHEYDLFLRVTEKTCKINHISKPLYGQRRIRRSGAACIDSKLCTSLETRKALQESLTRRGINGDVVDGYYGSYRVRYEIRSRPLVSIIIPTRDNLALLKTCVDSIESKTSYRNYEVIIVNHDSGNPEVDKYLKSLKYNVVKYSGEFNFSKMNNLGVSKARGEHIIFLNNDTEVIEPGWLEAMLEHSQRPEVGMVGALLLYPPSHRLASKIQHAGVILGVEGVAHHAFRDCPAESPGYFRLPKVIRNCSAVTAACAMMKKALFEEIGGFDESIPIAFGDLDLCLRLRKKGFLIIFTPYAVLYHKESASRGFHSPPEDETCALSRWLDTVSEGDPYYNRNLTFLREDYSIGPRPSAIIPLGVLLEIYQSRLDLQKDYPEVSKGIYQRLIDWAVQYGTTIDPYRRWLRPYMTWYVENVSEVLKPLAVVLALYNTSSSLQIKFPEVLLGNHQRLLAWALEVTRSCSKDDIVAKVLLPYKSWYERKIKPEAKPVQR